MTVVGSEQHLFEGVSLTCEAILYDEKGPRCGQDAAARVHQPPVLSAPKPDDRERLGDALEALTDLGMQYASQTIAMLRAKRERDSLARRLAVSLEQQKGALSLLDLALHLRMHGENAPGGDETWPAFDRRCEEFLRGVAGDRTGD